MKQEGKHMLFMMYGLAVGSIVAHTSTLIWWEGIQSMFIVLGICTIICLWSGSFDKEEVVYNEN